MGVVGKITQEVVAAKNGHDRELRLDMPICLHKKVSLSDKLNKQNVIFW
jgi:hypothetical protein